ncbi:MAG: 5-formyltetrahydrofolate cyclo-ligase [Candidatus Micrarchaeota archaeon]
MVQHLKAALRKDMLRKRDALSKEDVASMSGRIAKSLRKCDRYAKAKTVAFYLPKGNEVDTSGMIKAAQKDGKEVIVPVTDHQITFFRFVSQDDLSPGRFGIQEPRSRTIPSKEPDVIIVPGVSFGLCMHRLGYGKGYYDRYLSKSPAYRIGVCFDFQVAEKLPHHEDDERMDEILTEKRAIKL